MYLFVIQPHQLRDPIDKYPTGANIMFNKLSSKLGALNQGDIIGFRSVTNPDITETGIIESIDGEIITIANYISPIKRSDVIGKVMFCYANCKQ